MIGLVAQLLTFTSVFGLAIYACILGDPETSSIAHFCMVQMPSTLLRLIQNILPEQWIQKLSSLSEHGFQLIYLFVVLGSWSIGKCVFLLVCRCYRLISDVISQHHCSIQLWLSRN